MKFGYADLCSGFRFFLTTRLRRRRDHYETKGTPLASGIRNLWISFVRRLDRGWKLQGGDHLSLLMTTGPVRGPGHLGRQRRYNGIPSAWMSLFRWRHSKLCILSLFPGCLLHISIPSVSSCWFFVYWELCGALANFMNGHITSETRFR